MAWRRFTARLPMAVTAAVAVMSTMAATGSAATRSAAAEPGPDKPTIRYTEYGIPHIIASNWEGLGTGYGYAAAKDNVCTLADTYLMVNAQRSRYLGPDGRASPGQNQNGTTNLNSDLYFQRIKDNRVVERLLGQPAPNGPEPEVKEAIRGYVQGYNRYLAETGVNNISDPACRGAAWVRPITELDVYRHAHAEIIMGSADALLDGQVNAAPPGASAAAQPASSPAKTATEIRDAMAVSRQQSMGSNALAVGSQGVSGGTGMLLANPHFPWQGKNRMWQSQLTIPGEVNVSGAGLLGLPAVNIGYNNDVAWSHTVATVAPFGLFDVQVDPFNPTSYLVDGTWEKMTSQQVGVDVLNADGSLGKVTRTLWSTRYGPITTSIQGISLPWAVSAHAVRDVNMDNLRALNTWFRLDKAHDVNDVVNTLETTQGVPFFNTVASDRNGNALYADIQATPNITDEHAQSCLTETGKLLFNQSLRLPNVPPISIFDGKRSACDWPDDPNAVAPGLLDPHKQPRLIRSDFVGNANDSAWLANPEQPLSFPRVMGDMSAPRSLRTQELILTAQNRINGTDGLPGKGFTPQTMGQLLFADNSRAADLGLNATVTMCQSVPFGLILVLHGSPDDPVQQTYPALSMSDEMITVIPDGGARSWYANWLNQKTVLGAQNWENFHLKQVIPFIDANLRTIATKKSRAVAGVSMGGFGAFRYAQVRPDLFSQTASLSGDIDLSADSMDLRMAVVASVIDAAGAICGSASGACDPNDSPYKPGVDSDALFGSPYPVFNADWRWNEVDPSQHMDRLAGIGVSLYVGDGGGSPLDMEFWLAGAAKNVKARMDVLGMPYYYVNYGDGSGWGTQCNGGHNAGCWEEDLRDLIPRLERAFAS
ncbi:penicillin acylase family protein [Streptomyces sp. ISL-94]|uniref:penicillin acylase family protein n=1 Tax=Streptomyces sp. ISL-94 TaxID=2819190 RepID=UPI002035E74A|nr:penicillin acylase family protein [Streptomyces sp. ISL-94]